MSKAIEPDLTTERFTRWMTPDAIVVRRTDESVYLTSLNNPEKGPEPMQDPAALIEALRAAMQEPPAKVPDESTAVRSMVRDLRGRHPWLPGCHFIDRPVLAERLADLVEGNAEHLFAPIAND